MFSLATQDRWNFLPKTTLIFLSTLFHSASPRSPCPSLPLHTACKGVVGFGEEPGTNPRGDWRGPTQTALRWLHTRAGCQSVGRSRGDEREGGMWAERCVCVVVISTPCRGKMTWGHRHPFPPQPPWLTSQFKMKHFDIKKEHGCLKCESMNNSEVKFDGILAWLATLWFTVHCLTSPLLHTWQNKIVFYALMCLTAN